MNASLRTSYSQFNSHAACVIDGSNLLHKLSCFYLQGTLLPTTQVQSSSQLSQGLMVTPSGQVVIQSQAPQSQQAGGEQQVGNKFLV